MTNWKTRLILGAATGTAAALAVRVTRAYRRDLDTARARLDAVDKKLVTTPFGPVEYAESGTGDPVLVSHGIFHGCDGGLLTVSDVLTHHRVISPSRFGYLGSALPAGAVPQDQADAFAALLDHLEIPRVDIVGISAGTTAALEFALRHPDRTRHLVVISGSFPGDPMAAAPPEWAKLLYGDLPLWVLKEVAHSRLARLMGVPEGFPRTAEQAQVVDVLLESIFPVKPRTAGAIFDAYVSNPEVNSLPIERLTVPTLIIHAVDDPLCAFSAAEEAAHRIPGSRFVVQESGGHLGLGQAERTQAELDAFLTVPLVA